MLLTIYIFAILIGFCLRKYEITSAFLIFVMWVVFALNTSNPDYQTYVYIYLGYYGQTHEIGFDLMCTFFRNLGCSFVLFHGIICTTTLCFMMYAFKRLFGRIDSSGLAIILFYPFLTMTIAFRSSFALSIVYLALSLYLTGGRETKKGKVIFVAMIVLATSFHYTAIMFLVLFFIKEERPSSKVYIRAGIIVVIATVVARSSLIVTIGSIFLDAEKVRSWFGEDHRIGLGIVILYALHMGSYFIFSQSYETLFTPEHMKYLTKKEKYVGNLMYSMNVYSFYIAGFYAINMEFFTRLYVVFYVLNVMHVSWMYSKLRSKKMFVMRLLQFGYAIWIAWFLYSNELQRIVLQIMNNNLLF